MGTHNIANATIEDSQTGATPCLSKSGEVYMLSYGPEHIHRGQPLRVGACLDMGATFVATNHGITITHHVEGAVAESGPLPFGVSITKDWGTVLQLVTKHLDEDCVHCPHCGDDDSEGADM